MYGLTISAAGNVQSNVKDHGLCESVKMSLKSLAAEAYSMFGTKMHQNAFDGRKRKGGSGKEGSEKRKGRKKVNIEICFRQLRG